MECRSLWGGDARKPTGRGRGKKPAADLSMSRFLLRAPGAQFHRGPPGVITGNASGVAPLAREAGVSLTPTPIFLWLSAAGLGGGACFPRVPAVKSLSEKGQRR